MGYKKRQDERLGFIESSIDWENLLVETSPKFIEKFRERYTSKPGLVKRFKESLAIFLIDPFHPRIYNHQYKKDNYYSFSFGGDHRVIYYLKDKETAVLYDVGTHSQLFK